MKCFKCGAEVPAGRMACEKCGAIVFSGQNSGEKKAEGKSSQQPVRDNAGGVGFSIASMVLGIVSLVFSCLFIISIPCGIIGVSLGGYALYKGNPGRGQAIAGLVCSIVSIALCVLLFVLSVTADISILSMF